MAPSKAGHSPSVVAEFEGYIHVPFQLSTGESVVLSNADGDVVDALPIHPDLEAGYSWDAFEGETEDWCIFDAYPGEANQGTVLHRNRSALSLTVPSGWYDGELAVGIAGATAGYTARYTTNGDLPTASSPVFPDGGLVFDATTCLSVRVWDDGNEELPSDVKMRCTSSMNSIRTFRRFILVNEDDLGLGQRHYVMGPNASGDYPHFGANSWSRGPASPACSFDAEGTLQLRENMDLEIHGGWSRAEPQRSFRLISKTNTPATWVGCCFRQARKRHLQQHQPAEWRAAQLGDQNAGCPDQPARDANAWLREPGNRTCTSTANTGGCTAHVRSTTNTASPTITTFLRMT